MDSVDIKIGRLQLGIIILTILTALIHIYYSPQVPSPAGLILNGVGYVVLLAALYLPIAHAVPLPKHRPMDPGRIHRPYRRALGSCRPPRCDSLRRQGDRATADTVAADGRA